MKLEKKKALAAKTLGVGKERIVFNIHRLGDIKEAITKQDIRDLASDGAIMIKQIHGRKTVSHRLNRRRAGSIRKRVKSGKKDYVHLTRKLRTVVEDLFRKEEITREQREKLRKEIRASIFRSKSQLKEHLALLKKQ